jgi:D-sedoheptulose 7-phosphate isomerase
MIAPILSSSLAQLSSLLPALSALSPQLQRLGDAMFSAWSNKGKVLIAGNGGSAADAMHFAEELAVRYQKNRRALAAMALCDPTILTCAANDFGYESVFARQVEAFGNPGDIFIGLSTSGNSANILRAVQAAKSQKLITCSFLGKDGGQLKGQCDIELLVPSSITARVQECHQLLYHVLCEWIESKVD